MGDDGDAAQQEHRGGTPVLEYVSAGLGAVLVLFVLGVVAWHALTGTNTPPDLQVTVLEIREQQSGFAVQFQAVNAGERTAADVTIEGSVGEDTGTSTLDFVPGGGQREGTLVFAEDPRGDGKLQIRVRGFREP